MFMLETAHRVRRAPNDTRTRTPKSLAIWPIALQAAQRTRGDSSLRRGRTISTSLDK